MSNIKGEYFLIFNYYDRNEDVENQKKEKKIKITADNKKTGYKKAGDLWKKIKESGKYSTKIGLVMKPPIDPRLVFIAKIL